MLPARGSIRGILAVGLLALTASASAEKQHEAKLEKRQCSTTITIQQGASEEPSPSVISRCDQLVTVSRSEAYATARANCAKAGPCSVIPGADPIIVPGPTHIMTRIPVETAVLHRYEDLDDYEQEWQQRKKRAMQNGPKQTPCPGMIQKCWPCGKPQKCCTTNMAQAVKTNFMVPFPTYTVYTTVTSWNLPTWTVELQASVEIEKPAVETLTVTDQITVDIPVQTTIYITEPATTTGLPTLITDTPNFELQFPLPDGYRIKKKRRSGELVLKKDKKRRRKSSQHKRQQTMVYINTDENGLTSISQTAQSNYTLVGGSLFTQVNETAVGGSASLMAVLNETTWAPPLNFSALAFADTPPSSDSIYYLQWGLVQPADNAPEDVTAAVYIFAGQVDSSGTTISLEQVSMCVNNNNSPGAQRLFLVPRDLPGICDNIAVLANGPLGGQQKRSMYRIKNYD